MTTYIKISVEIGFLEFFQKSPGGSRMTSRQHKYQTQFLGSSDEPPGGREWTARWHEHNYTIFSHFLYFWGAGMWPWFLDARVWIV